MIFLIFFIRNDKEINEIIKNCAKMVYEKSVTIGDSVERLIYDGTNEKVYTKLIFKIIDEFTKNICKRITYKKSYNELFGILDYIETHKENICKNLTNKTVMIIGNIICEKISAKYGDGMIAAYRKNIIYNTINKITNEISDDIYEKLNDHIHRVIDERIFYEVIGQQSK